MIQSTHVGSLPFKDVDQALDYTFKWDIPVIFTLPNLDSRQYIGKDIFTLLGIDYTAEARGIRIPKDYSKRAKKIIPFYLDEFIKRASRESTELIKYQMVGPVTLYALLSNKEEIDFYDLWNFLQERYEECLSHLCSYHSLFFVLDEPLLRENVTFYQDSNFLGPIENFCEDLFIHCCDGIDLTSTKPIEEKLHLDLKLFFDRSVVPKNCSYLGIDTTFFDLPEKLGVFCEEFKNVQYLSPSCGLANSNFQEVESIFNEISLIKDFFSTKV